MNVRPQLYTIQQKQTKLHINNNKDNNERQHQL